MAGITARAAYTCAMRLMPKMRCHVSLESSSPPGVMIPALAQNRSRGPWASMAPVSMKAS